MFAVRRTSRLLFTFVCKEITLILMKRRRISLLKVKFCPNENENRVKQISNHCVRDLFFYLSVTHISISNPLVVVHVREVDQLISLFE